MTNPAPTAEERVSLDDRATQVANYTKAQADGWFFQDVRDAALRHLRATEQAAREPLERRIAELESDCDENYIQGIQRGGLLAITAINGLLKQGDAMIAREHMRCTEAIAAAIKEGTKAQRALDEGGE